MKGWWDDCVKRKRHQRDEGFLLLLDSTMIRFTRTQKTMQNIEMLSRRVRRLKEPIFGG